MLTRQSAHLKTFRGSPGTLGNSFRESLTGFWESGTQYPASGKILDNNINSISVFFSDIRDYIKYIEKSVATKEPRYMLRVSRGLNSIRNRINPIVLRRLLQGYIQAQVQVAIKDELLGFLDEVLRNCFSVRNKTCIATCLGAT